MYGFNNSSKIANIELSVNNPRNLDDLKNSLFKIKEEKSKINQFSNDYIWLCHLECVTRQKIHSSGYCSIDESIKQLSKALDCTEEIQVIYPHIKNNNPIITPLISLQEKACILCELGRFDNHTTYLKEAVQIFKYIRENNNEDKQLQGLTIMNEANARLDLAKNGISNKENSLLSIRLSEKAISYFDKHDHRHTMILQNLSNAIFELSRCENYGIRLKLINFAQNLSNMSNDYEENLDKLSNDIQLVELGFNDVNELDIINNKIKKIRNTLSEDEHAFHFSFILEQDIYINKIKFSKNYSDKVEDLNNIITLIENYIDNHEFWDRYYLAIALTNEAYFRLQLAKLNVNKEKNLKLSFNLLLLAKEYYEETPLQNNEIYYPKVLSYLALTMKELSIIDGTLHENYEEIKNLFFNSMKYFEKNSNYDEIINTFFELGELFFYIEKFEKSYYYLKKGIDLIEFNRDTINNFQLKENFFKKFKKVYEMMILTCYSLNKKEETLHYIELSKHRIFLDKISKKQEILHIKPVQKELINEINNLNFQIGKFLFKLDKFNENYIKFSFLYEKLLQLRNQKEYYMEKVKKEYPQYYDYYYNHVYDYSNIDLNDKTLIEYYYFENILFICLIDSHNFIIKKIDIENFSIPNLVNDFMTCIEKSFDIINSDLLNKIDLIMENLFEILITPIKNYLINTKLIIIPYKELHNIPFYCLKNKIYLIDNYTITILQSGFSIKYLLNNYDSNNREYLVIGNPNNDLPNAEDEAIKIAKILKTTPIINNEATKEKILKSINKKQIIHYAGHASFNYENPLKSYLRLNDHRLFVYELTDHNINAELIVLSACESGVVFVDDNDETEGFINNLQIDGAKYIIASLWPIFDSSSKELFEYFYLCNEDFPERLRDSQLMLKEKYDILNWGAFQIYGV